MRCSTPYLISATVLLAGCSTPQGEFPSLAKRAYESNAPITEPVAEEALVAESLPDGLGRQLAGIEARHRAADAAYHALLSAVQAAVGRSAGSAPGSEAWVSANVDLSRLDHARADSVAASGEVDALAIAQHEADAQSDQPMIAPLLEARQKAIASDVEQQSAEINRLAALLGE